MCLPAAASVLLTTVASVVGLTVIGSMTRPAGADPLTGCTTTTGVIVAVDFTHWGQSVQRGCEGTVTSGTTSYQALVAAGFTPAGDQQDGPAFMCRIDDLPTPQQDPCITTPPATAYWSFWYAPAGQDSWSYSQYGAMSFLPTPGSVNAWSFGAGTPPSFAPSAVWATTVGPPGGGSTTTTAPVVPPPTTTPSAGAPSTGQAGGGATSSVGGESVAPTASSSTGGAHSTSATTTPTTSPPTTPVSTTTDPGGSGTVTPTTRPGQGPKIVDVSPVAAHASTSAGSPLPLVVGAAVLAVLVGSGGLIARRRRRTG